MTDEKKLTREDAYSQFSICLSAQAFWLQDAAWRIYNGKKIDDSQVQAYVDMCIKQAKKITPFYNCLGYEEIVPDKRRTKISVVELSDIAGVNALASEAKLQFSQDGVTVVYGLNGAGKSGFMRIFKQLSANPYKEPIQPNIFKKSESRTPSCKFAISQDGTQNTVTCDLTENNMSTPLAQCDVFDTRISSAYISNTNNVSYQPFVFTVLSELAKTADAITKQIEHRIEGITDTVVSVPEEFADYEQTKWITDIGVTTVFPVEYSTWDESCQESFSELLGLLDTEKVMQKLEIARSKLKSIDPIIEDLIAAQKTRDSESFQAAYSKFVDAKTRLDSARKLFSENADEQDQISVSSSDWQSLWSTAKKYYESVLFEKNGHHFSEDGSICPLCHQTITGDIFNRFANVNEYVNGTCNSDYENALNTYRELCTMIFTRTYSSQQLRPQLIDILLEENIITIKSTYIALASLISFDDTAEYYATIKAIDINSAIEVLNDKKSSLEGEIQSLNDALEDEIKAELNKKLNDLKCHKWIYDNKQRILLVISNTKQIKELGEAKQYLFTNKITKEANTLAQILISEAYIERFTRELKLLAPGIKVKLEKAASLKGNSPYKVSLDSDSGNKCKPEEILSEGEQRIVALAAFFADATGRNELTPIIIDDPISSLDIKYEEKATQRIVELSMDRQVMVFTHRISLLVGLSETCERLDVKFTENHIRGTSTGKGIPDFGDEYRGKISSQLNGLRSKLAETKKKDPNSSEYYDALWRACQTFRKCVERSVEDILLMGMVHRFDRRIMTNNKVTKLTEIKTEDCEIVDNMMTKYSFTEHSQPIDSPPVEIDIDELDKDIELFVKWVADYNKRMN